MLTATANATANAELPKWPGASECYSRAYAMLSRMSHQGVAIRRGKCYPSPDMVDLIDALNAGCEESIKGLLLTYLDRGY